MTQETTANRVSAEKEQVAKRLHEESRGLSSKLFLTSGQIPGGIVLIFIGILMVLVKYRSGEGISETRVPLWPISAGLVLLVNGIRIKFKQDEIKRLLNK